MRSLAGWIVFGLRQAGIALAFLALLPLSPELAIALAGRYMEPIMPTATLPKRDASALTKAALGVMAHFAETPETEPAFYCRFQTLSRAQRTALKMYYVTSDEWQIFRQICAFWRIGGARRTEATRRLRAIYRQPVLFR